MPTRARHRKKPRARRPKTGRPQEFTDQQMLDALKAAKGMVYLAAKALGCAANTIYERAKVSQGVAHCMKEETGLVNDVAELKLYEAILRGESWAVMFCLRTKGRHRGYGDKAEVEVTGVTLQIVEEIVDAPDENHPKDEDGHITP